MANDPDIRVGIQAFTQKRTTKTVKVLLFAVMPTLEFMFALSGDKTAANGLGRPKTGIMIASLNGVAGAQREKIYAERSYLGLQQTAKPSKTEVKSMGDRDSNPQVPNWQTTNRTMEWFTQPRWNFTRKKIPYKVAHSDIRTAKAGAGSPEAQAAAAVTPYDAEVKTRMGVLCEQINDELFGVGGQPGYPTNAQSLTWDHLYSIEQAVHDTSLYAGIDRSQSQNAWFRGVRVTSTFNGSFEDMINFCNYDKGMLKKGLGVQIIAVGGALMKKAKAEAKANSYQLFTQGIPDFPEFGFKREVVRIYSGNRPVYIYYDPAVPDTLSGDATNYAYCIDPSTWTVSVHPDSNFAVSKPADQTLVEGGDEADTGTIAAELLLACEVPAGNAVFTDVAL